METQLAVSWVEMMTDATAAPSAAMMDAALAALMVGMMVGLMVVMKVVATDGTMAAWMDVSWDVSSVEWKAG